MNRYIEQIKINQIFHLRDIIIPINDEKTPHLIITGKNGSGKTSVLNAIAEVLDKIKNDTGKSFLTNRDTKEYYENLLKDNKDPTRILQYESIIKSVKKTIDDFYGKVDLVFTDIDHFIREYQNGNFIIAFYQADRKVKMSEPKNPTKPDIQRKWNIKETATHDFLNFLSDLKIQEALARNEKLVKDADIIAEWFKDLEDLLKEIFQDKELRLLFNYKDYSFKIETDGKAFKFTEMSDGFAAVLDIIVDLILKMQHNNNITRAYKQEGIVLIDEIETHLHLELQKVIMPLLTKIFPNIQFIVTTHSPFVLSSLKSAVAFDLEHKNIIADLTEYSYESLAEGYFGVKTESSYAEMQLEKLNKLLQKENLLQSEEKELKDLLTDFDKIPEPVSPTIVGRYFELKSTFIEKIKSLEKND